MGRAELGFKWKSVGAKQCPVISWLPVTTSDFDKIHLSLPTLGFGGCVQASSSFGERWLLSLQHMGSRAQA